MKLVHEILDYSSRDSGLQLLSISAERGERDEVWSTATPVAGRPHFGSEPFLPIWDNSQVKRLLWILIAQGLLMIQNFAWTF